MSWIINYVPYFLAGFHIYHNIFRAYSCRCDHRVLFRCHSKLIQLFDMMTGCKRALLAIRGPVARWWVHDLRVAAMSARLQGADLIETDKWENTILGKMRCKLVSMRVIYKYPQLVPWGIFHLISKIYELGLTWPDTKCVRSWFWGVWGFVRGGDIFSQENFLCFIFSIWMKN